MMNRNLSKKKELILFGVATYTFSWLFWIPSAVMFRNVESIADVITSPVFIVLQTLGAAGPSIVAYFFLKKFHGEADLKAIGNRYKIWRLDKKWYLVSILLVISISLVSLLLHTLLLESPLEEGHALYDMYQSMGPALVLVLPLIFASQMVTSPLLEEFGWRGYAQPLLQKMYGVLASSMIIGLVWGFWHLPLILVYGHNLLVAIISIICHSILMGWVLNSTRGSMLMMLLFHASINVGLNMLSPGHGSVIMLIVTVSVTGAVVYHILRTGLEPFNADPALQFVAEPASAVSD